MNALGIGMLCCVALQAAAAVLALRLHSPVPPSLGLPCPRLPRARAHHWQTLLLRRASPPLPRRRPKRPLLQDLLNRGHLRLRGGRHHQLPGPPAQPRGVGLGSRASTKQRIMSMDQLVTREVLMTSD